MEGDKEEDADFVCAQSGFGALELGRHVMAPRDTNWTRSPNFAILQRRVLSLVFHHSMSADSIRVRNS